MTRRRPGAAVALPLHRPVLTREDYGMDLDITTRGTRLRPEWRDLIESRASRLARKHARLVRLRVILEGSRHHQEGAHEVRLGAALPGQTLHASKAEPEMRDALHAAFEALERELAEVLP